MTSELERIKILEGKISQVVEYINKLISQNEMLKQQVKELKAEKKTYIDQAKKADKLDHDLKTFEKEREVLKDKIETIISQIDQLEL